MTPVPNTRQDKPASSNHKTSSPPFWLNPNRIRNGNIISPLSASFAQTSDDERIATPNPQRHIARAKDEGEVGLQAEVVGEGPPNAFTLSCEFFHMLIPYEPRRACRSYGTKSWHHDNDDGPFTRRMRYVPGEVLASAETRRSQSLDFRG